MARRKGAEIVDHDDYCELVLRNKFKQEVGRAKFDKRHRSKVAPLSWNLSHGYPKNVRFLKSLHQIIKAKKNGFEIDHINGDRLDNRDANLRYATRTQNARNLPLSKRNRSGWKGIWFDPVTQSWQVKICVDRKQIFLGRFKNLEEAVSARKVAELSYYGKFARMVLYTKVV